MGIIKLKDITLYEGPLASVEVISNWCDSMAQYYPYIVITYVDILNNELISKRISPDKIHLPEYISCYHVELDSLQADHMTAILRKQAKEKEAKRIGMHKLVKVVRGRKVPIGTTGEIMWMGDSGYGPSVGIRLIDGKVVFTSQRNVETVLPDEEFEIEVLGLKS